MDPVVIIHNRTEKRINFLMELEGRVVSSGVCKIQCVKANKVIEVSQIKILRCFRRHQTSWKIRVLVDEICSGLVIEPIDMLNYTWIVFSYETVDGSEVLKAKGLRTRGKSSRFLLQLRWSLGLGSKRHREYRMLEEMYGLQDIGEARVTDEGMRSVMEYYSLEYQQPFHINSMKAAHISTASIKQEIKRWENAVVGYIATEDMKDYDVNQFVKEHWKNFGSFEIHELEPHFFLFNFTNEDDKRKLLEHGHWFVCSRPFILKRCRPFILKRWTPNLALDPNFFISTLPVWVRFLNLNLEFWSADSIAKIASVIGKPLYTDEATALKKKLQYARVCIEVNPMEELPNIVPIWCDAHRVVFNQSVEYEWTPQLCRHCQSLLHDSSTCIISPNVPSSLNADSCEQLWDEDKVILQSLSPVSAGIHGAATVYDTGNEVSALTDEADAQADTNICISTFGANAIQEICDIEAQEMTDAELQRATSVEFSEDLKNYSATARLLGSGKTASKRWLAYSKQKAMALVGTTNSWIAIISES